ncbi:hypothetical protein [Terrabacter sp. MAHUQ-38]|uniref:hypothetical protein n=1 Tax=unclassified Terrabacter TaxID=2630222 RepID=UPI00165D71F0|nr:hypothetical protein [Terrabacter sp. MAHUQ-38]MBC9820517.1 hypothetical protein [Terrabacter sp. MAHUQ-38]
MSRLQIGPAVLMVPDHGGTEVETTDMGGDAQHALEVAGVVAAGDVLLELTYQRWEDGGQCAVTSRVDSPPEYERLVNRLRMGVRASDDGTDVCELGIAKWDHKNPFGSMRQATVADLDAALDGSASAFLVEAGALDTGTRAEVLGDQGRRRNYLCARFPAGDPLGPLVAFVITRIVPMLRKQGVSE